MVAVPIAMATLSDESPSKDSDADDIITGIQIFYKEVERQIRAKDPNASFGDVAAKVDQEWKNLPKERQKSYKDLASQRNKRLIEKETRHLPANPEVVTIDDSDDEKVQDDDIVWENDPNSKKIVVAAVKRCIRLGCPNIAKLDPQWDEEFCSEKCVIAHCKSVFNRWKDNRMPCSNSS